MTEFLIGASILQAVLFGFGAWYTNHLRCEYWGAEVSRVESMLLGATFEVQGEGSSLGRMSEPGDVSIDRSGFEAERRGRVNGDVAEGRFERFMGSWIQLAMLSPIVVIVFSTELVSFIVWQIRTHENLGALGSDGLKFESRSSALWWFVPIVVLWKPMQIAQEIWRASDPSVAVGDELGWRLRPGSTLVSCWWSLLLIVKMLYWSGLLMLLCHMTSILSPMALWVIASGTGGVASLLQVGVVRSTAKRQIALERKRVAAVKKAEAEGEPTVDADAMLIRIKKPSDSIVAVGPIGAIATGKEGVFIEADRFLVEVSEGDTATTRDAFFAGAEMFVLDRAMPVQEFDLAVPIDGAADQSPSESNGCEPEADEPNPSEPVDEPLLLTEEAHSAECGAIAVDGRREAPGDAGGESGVESVDRPKEGF